jgi:hypothetical protein
MNQQDERGRYGGVTRRTMLQAGAAVTIGGLFSIGAPFVAAQDGRAAPLEIEVVPFGAQQGELDEIARSLRGGRGVPRTAGRLNVRVISVREIDPEEKGKSEAERALSEGRWRAIVYDYAAQRTLMLEGRLGSPVPDVVRTLNSQPIPSPAEWEEARDTLLDHPQFGPPLRAGNLIAYRPMPPVIVGPNGHRLITVGLLPRSPSGTLVHEIVAVDLATGAVQRFAARTPETSLTRGDVCGAPLGAGQSTTGQGQAGQYAVTIQQGSTVYWTFTAVRPSNSSGLRGSGIELRNVRYRGRLVLSRAHLPILNVKYAGNACGPYRDWQFEEGMLQADGTNVAPGFRQTTSAPETIIQSGTDDGNFLGTALWINGSQVTLRSELEAGWYRYISEWTLHTDGRIQPRFGFAAVQNTCVCNAHYHHCYWRFNFDIGGSGNNFVQQFNNGAWAVLPREKRAFRDAALLRKWRVGARGERAKYLIRPNSTDGRAAGSPDWPFGVADLWFLRYHANEIDDGVDVTSGNVEARLDDFRNGESIDGADLVVWYAGHFSHVQPADERGGTDHLVGPDLVPINW